MSTPRKIRPYSRWTWPRIARFGYLVGLGWDAERIAKDPIVRSTKSSLHLQEQRLGLSFLTSSVEGQITLTPAADEHDEAAPAKRGLTRTALIRVLLHEIASEEHLLQNIMDDGL